MLILFLLVTAGCVGTVQETSTPGSLKFDNPPTTFTFPGIVTARAVSHNKVELEFYPASGQNISYKLYVNNSTTPYPIDPQSLLTVNGGRLLYTVDNLLADREYKFKIVATNISTNAVSVNENEAYSRTFDNVVADFDGISKVSLVPGNTSGSILVDWLSPTMTGIFTAGPYDPVRYEVTLISEIGGAGNLNNPLYFGTDKRIVLVPSPPARATPLSNPQSVLVDGLAANTRYFVQVRAINALYQNYAEDPDVVTIPVSKESNTKYLSVKTDAAGSLFDFRQDNVVLTNAPGSDAFDKIDVFWQAGIGAFSGYRIFVRKYDGIGDPTLDDKLTEGTLNSMTLSGNYYSVASALTNRRITGLESYSTYQVKVALCKTISCPVSSADPNVAIISDLKSIRVQPTLAPFSGINNIEPPGQFSEKDVVNLKFDAPLINSGFANVLEFYCVNPADHSQMVKLSGVALSGSGIGNCDGVFLSGAAPALSAYSQQKLKGLKTDGTTEYCFAATPAIIGFGPDVRLATANRIVRCSFPEVMPPSIAQFPGLNNTCAISGVSGNVTWNLPTGGIYSGFKVFWKEKTSSEKFSFPYAAASDPDYLNSGELAASITNYTVPNLMPGKTYQVGVLATVDMDVPVPDLYSEYNLNIIDCVIPLPIATFQGFTRIFAVGPKMDGRMPNDQVTKAPPVSGANNALLYEALDNNGIPFEVAMDSMNVPNISANFTAPPGRDAGTNFSGEFDGVSESGFGYAMSRDGIISLAWEDVQMNFPEAYTIFANNQPAPPVARNDRIWGYKVFRSTDNKLTWKELTTTNGPVYSMAYSYYKRPNVGATNTRMAFFTDYSVKAMYETHDAANGRDIERARTYYYKIIPVFNGQLLNYSAGNGHIVKVTLPPPNMALVHRWMANRARCLELDKTPQISLNYSCPYNGIGAKPRSIPFRVGDTSLDQGGDLLVDRQELGCRYTRGEKTEMPELSASNFNYNGSVTKRHPDDENNFPLFRGYRTVSNVEDPSTPFRGCVGRNLANRGTSTGSDYPGGFVAEYQRYLQGDCFGPHLDRIAFSACSTDNYAAGTFTSYYINTPGSDLNPTTPPDCSQPPSPDPTNLVDKYTGFFAPNYVMQSEFLAVFYNSYPINLVTSERNAPIEGPDVGSLTSSRRIDLSWGNTAGSASCSINLASIDSSGYMRPRWMSMTELGIGRVRFKDDYPVLLDKTVDEITEVAASTTEPLTLYNGMDGDLTPAEFKLPVAGLRSSNRYRGSTRLAKIMTSNSAKLPPLGRVSPELGDVVCSTYYVQTGIASDNGNFAPDMQPKKKRPLRRIESVAASAWPETFNTAAITNIESGTSTGSCNSASKNVSPAGLSKGNRYTNRTPVSSTPADVPLVTGSSAYSGNISYTEATHTGRCISRFGVQDIVGNMAEVNSEKFFCDYGQDQINLGPVTGTWAGGDAAQNAGAGGPDYPFFNNNTERTDWAVLRQGTPTANDGSSFEIRFRNGDPPITDARPWVRISVDSGYCSPVDNDPNKRRPENLSDFRDVSTDVWANVFLPGGALNTNLIERTQEDQESINTLRNGDGRFLDFGPQGLASALNTLNKIALSGSTAVSKYFNPVLGIPLACSTGSCNDTSLSSFLNDNTSVTTTTLSSNILAGTDDAPAIVDFPIGNSQISSLGISEYQYASTGYQTATVPASGGTVSNLDNILQAVLVDDPITMGNPVRIIKQFPEDFTPGDTVEYYRVIWEVERNARMSFISGGSSNATNTGRYTASISKAGYETSTLGYGSHLFTQGIRCAVMINQD